MEMSDGTSGDQMIFVNTFKDEKRKQILDFSTMDQVNQEEVTINTKGNQAVLEVEDMEMDFAFDTIDNEVNYPRWAICDQPPNSPNGYREFSNKDSRVGINHFVDQFIETKEEDSIDEREIFGDTLNLSQIYRPQSQMSQSPERVNPQ